MTDQLIQHSNQGLYHPDFEHDSCGIGFVANLRAKKSHGIVESALSMLSCMEHRGGTGFDIRSGDGAGVLIQIPHEFLVAKGNLGFDLPEPEAYALGMVFFPQQEALFQPCKERLLAHAAQLGLTTLGFRKVPVDNSGLGDAPLATEPNIQQWFIARPEGMSYQEFERKLYVLRNYSIHKIQEEVAGAGTDFYIISLSSRTVIYKGQLTTAQVREYYLDLQDPECVSALAMFHSRFSTNTFPAWRLAQPFRYISHNGEINTVRGNINWMKAREALLETASFTEQELAMIKPINDRNMSDSANLDMVVELLLLSGRPLAQVMMMLVPEAWQNQPDMEPTKRAFYEYYASVMEPWDGPASLGFTDGKIIGATLDRNGLRPSRFLVTEDDTIVMGSETGALVVNQSKVVRKGRLQPGKIFIADLEQGRIISDDEVKSQVCSQQPYAQWVKQHQLTLQDLPKAQGQAFEGNLLQWQQAFGVSKEELTLLLAPMGEGGKEALGSMGTDNALPVLSEQPQHLSNYFKQLFAQVTNPPIDPIREAMVMSLYSYLGRQHNLLAETPEHAAMLRLDRPVLSNDELASLLASDKAAVKAVRLDMLFNADGQPGRLAEALDALNAAADQAVRDGATLLVLSDRGMNKELAAIPSLLATASVHHHLIRNGLRALCGLVVETADAREVHHFATLVGYGAGAVNPYLAFASLEAMSDQDEVSPELSKEKLTANFMKAVDAGLLKIFSKMGISTLQSYQGAQIFEALGISTAVIDQYFTGTVSRIQGLSLDDIAREALAKHQPAFAKDDLILSSGGQYSWRFDGERHLFNPTTIRLLQHSTALNDGKLFKEYAKAVDDQAKAAYTLRGLFEFNSNRPSVPLDEVEPKESIFKRFATGAMSFGSISWEAHTTLAAAMNRIGGKSNSGEGGEDPIRFKPQENGDSLNSAIKQVASGRFGVTSHYLANAVELQIKMAQGAKPGEGGQLPGEKVDAWIGRTRGATPGVGLISPPPHHDIYSIEDLAQLIFDLKNANPDARVNVKLVSEAGVGTVASGVAKGYADVILIAGHDGGTGASPLTSVKHCGLPWELGLAEAHQTLVRNRLRSRVVVQADGQMKTPRDLAIATLLGAEEWGVATAALIVEGCIMMRKCHLNTCPVGVATQDPDLRRRFSGQVQHVVNFFTFLAEGLREIMAELGFRSVDEMVGHAEVLKVVDSLDHWKYQNLDLSPILYRTDAVNGDSLCNSEQQKHHINDIVDRQMIKDAKAALEQQLPVKLEYYVRNINRSVGTMLSYEVSKRHGAQGLPQDCIQVECTGSAGQSFAAFGAKGLSFTVLGDANDYFGKGLSGARLVLKPAPEATFKAQDNIILGNVAFFGATAGDAYINGVAGERFCVRNSGVTAVVEGVGDHGCEYMTGGKAVILGGTGRNFAAGMSGGVAYIFDKAGTFAQNCNMEMVYLSPVADAAEQQELKALIERHLQYTGSDVAAQILANWQQSLQQFVRVMPHDYERMMGYMQQARDSQQYNSEYEIAEAAFNMHMANLKQQAAKA